MPLHAMRPPKASAPPPGIESERASMSSKKPVESNAKGGGKPAAKKSPSARPDDMPADVLEFITAIDDYKRLNNRPFPSWSEILDVIKELGYEKSDGLAIR